MITNFIKDFRGNGRAEQYNKMDTTLTIGERRVRTTFDPSNDSTVDQIKQKAAELINLFETLRDRDSRCAEYGQTLLETACMYGVKAATA